MSSSSSDTTVVENLPSTFNFVNTDDGRINFLAGMGLTDEQYSMILQNLVNEDGLSGAMDESIGPIEKRPLEEPGDDGRNGKRSRFEVIE
jgi:osomolarity two-component system response regulator SKN7